ncbi:hypothetical protein EDM80_09035 [bacterium]|nr:MAG: hypothetical protein EDM80_09035 [bacterium]RIK61537.1 MAG: hypothetical protein DCC64_13125 [Planctomycetota bacterium]
MDVALVVLMVLVAAAITFSPLLRRRRVWFVGDFESDFTLVVRQREEALRALKDLEEDLHARKLTQADYDRLRPMHLDRAKELTLKLDAINAKMEEARRRVEQQLAASRKQG